MPRVVTTILYIEDLFWIRTLLRQQIDTHAVNGCAPKANRIFAFVKDLCDSYQDSEHDKLHVKLRVQEKD